MLLSVFFGFVSVLLNWLLPDDLLGILLNAVGAALLVIWVFIVIAHLRLRPKLEREGKLTVRMWLFPYLSYLTLVLLGGFVVLMAFDEDARKQLISTAVLFLVILALGLLTQRHQARKSSALAESDAQL